MTDAPLLVAIDASTTSCKAIVFDSEGRTISEGRSPLSLENPEPDGYEQNANAWWEATVQAVSRAVLGVKPKARARLLAGAVTHQRETVVVTDAAGEPLAPALVWMDARCRDEVAAAARNIGAIRLHALSGKAACTTPSLYKLMYLFRHHPELVGAAHVADVHGFLARRLVGRSVSSFASADPMGLVDMRKRRWAKPLLKLLNLESHQLPALVEPGAPIGVVEAGAARRLELPRGFMFYAGAGDGQAAALGAGLVSPGRAYLNLGTAVVSGVLQPDYQIDQAFRTLYAANPGQYCLETDLQGGTFTINWLFEKFLGHRTKFENLEDLEARAPAVPAGSDGLVVLPYWCGVMNPYWNDDATGMVLGLHGGHGPEHFYRAVLEGIALEQRLHLEGVEAVTGKPSREIVVMGGGSRSELWCQILADVLGRVIVRCETPEATALGAAILAAVGHGIQELRRCRSEDDPHGPAVSAGPRPSLLRSPLSRGVPGSLLGSRIAPELARADPAPPRPFADLDHAPGGVTSSPPRFTELSGRSRRSAASS